jgi:hypothetical protein
VAIIPIPKTSAKTCYIVSFQVATAPSRSKLTALMKGFGSYCPITHTCWAVMSDLSANAIRDHLAEALEPADRIFVIRSGTAAAWRNAFSPKHTEWLRRNL